MFLEAQFGPNITPIMKPKLSKPAKQGVNGTKDEPGKEMTDEDLDMLEADELTRLHSVGIPVPGVEIKVDKYVAKVWLETLEVECASQVFAQRVTAVVDRAAETIAPLWAQQKKLP